MGGGSGEGGGGAQRIRPQRRPKAFPIRMPDQRRFNFRGPSTVALAEMAGQVAQRQTAPHGTTRVPRIPPRIVPISTLVKISRKRFLGGLWQRYPQ